MAELFFEHNRRKLFKEMTDFSAAVLFAGQAPVKRGDELYPFSPDRNFYYVTGIDSEKCIVLFTKIKNKNNCILYIERDNGYLAKWVGAVLTAEEAKSISGIEQIKYIDEFQEDMAELIFKNNIQNFYLDMEKRDWSSSLSPSLLYAKEVREKFPALQFIDLYSIFAGFRQKKEPYELNLMQKAIDITRMGIEEMMKHAKVGMFEYEIEAYFDFVLTKSGVRQKAFQSIAASGKNGTILHYNKNTGKTKEGDLILFDVGAQVNWYNGDLTRTFPVSGKFTQKQKLIYTIVLEGQQKVIDAIKPGLPFGALNEILKEHYFEELCKIGLIQTKEEVSRYYYHGVSHHLGAETHDIGRYMENDLTAGMVITVEPGLYIEEWEIGIRIEDDVLVTDNGCEVLSKDMIKTVEEIETFMAGEQ